MHTTDMHISGSVLGRLAALVMLLALSVSSTAAERIALVIGNETYAERPLENPVNDAEAMSAKLEGLGFEVTTLKNATLTEMRIAVKRFGRLARQGQSTDAVVFFAGHGAQLYGANYLMPVNAQMGNEDEMTGSALELGTILRAIEGRQNGVNIVILDACRDNPLAALTRGGSRGLAPVKPAETGTLILFAARPGQTALDGETGKNGVFTSAILEALDKPGLDEDDFFELVSATVERRTSKKQIPWTEGRISGDFVFNLNAPAVVNVNPAPASPVAPRSDREVVFWETVRDSEDEALYLAYLEQYPRGDFVAIARIKLKRLVIARLKPEKLKKAETAQREPKAPQATSIAPQPATPAPDTKQARIESLLADAEKDLKSLRLTSPTNNNAVAKYKEVLELEPGNTNANQGLDRVVDRYVALAKQRADQGQAAAALRYLERAEDVKPGDAEVAEVRRRVSGSEPKPQAQRIRGADFEKGVAAYDNGDYAIALREWTPLAKQGHARAQAGLGVMYEEGQGVPQDYKTAVKWYTLAAEQGDTYAQTNLGHMYDNGDGVPQDYKTAVKWYTLAAEQGDADAQYNLGFMFDEGKGVPENDKTAVKWWTLAAKQGNADAQFNLGLMYATGQGVVQDNVYAHMWWSIAASSGDKDAIENRDEVAGEMTPSQLEKAQDLARECVRKKYKDC